MKGINKLFQLPQKKDKAIRLALDATMIFFIVFALYAMIFDDLKYSWLALLIIGLYSMRIWKLAKGYEAKTIDGKMYYKNEQVHSLDELNPNYARLKDFE